MTPKTKQEAIAAGARRYLPDAPCRHGHHAERTIRGHCTACQLEYSRRPDVAQRHRDQAREWASRHPDRATANAKKYRERHPEKAKTIRLAYRARTPERQAHLQAARRARKMRATPAWADAEAMRAFYKACPAGHHVDHVIPLSGREVCGLHTLENLQYLPASENCRKSNRLGGAA